MKGKGNEGAGKKGTFPYANLESLLVEAPDVVAEILLEQEGYLVFQHLRRRRRRSGRPLRSWSTAGEEGTRKGERTRQDPRRGGGWAGEGGKRRGGGSGAQAPR